MRKVLVTLFGSGLAVSLILSSCVVKDNTENDATGGSAIPMGGQGPIITTQGGGTGVGGGIVAEPCTGLLESLQVGDTSAVCSQSKVEANFTKINMLIVLDKSGSMTSTPVGYAKAKWAGAVDALKGALNPADTLISYGFILYPFPAADAASACELATGAAAINVGVGPASETVPQINALMAATGPSGGTPTAAALGAALDYYTKGAGVGIDGSKYVLLVTDGGPNCNADVQCQVDTCTAFMDRSPNLSSCWNGGVANCCDRVNATSGGLDPQALCLDDGSVTNQLNALRNAGINTFVIGIPGSEAYATYLDGFADAGGEPVAGKLHKYYEVAAEDDLAKAFTDITTKLVDSCVVPLEQAPQDKNKINVAIDCAALPQTTGGVVNWTYDEPNQSIVIEGPRCEAIKAAGAQRIDVINGCPIFIIQ